MVLVKFLHLMSLSIWVGSVVFFSFFAAPSIFKKLPREAAGDVVGDIFPKYSAVGYACGAILLVTLALMMRSDDSAGYSRPAVLIIMAGASLYSGLVVNRNAASLKVKMRETVLAEEKDALRLKFRK